jgi:hypothetical protein
LPAFPPLRTGAGSAPPPPLTGTAFRPILKTSVINERR